VFNKRKNKSGCKNWLISIDDFASTLHLKSALALVGSDATMTSGPVKNMLFSRS
jgi:hypothetical protein